MAIRVLLADDQALIRAGFKVLLDSAPDIEVVGEAGTGTEAVHLAGECDADVVLMDIRMPGLDGIEATRQIVSDESLADVRVLILTTFEVDDLVFGALRAGASGFLNKGVEPEALLEAVRVVAAGEALLSPRATRSLISRVVAQPDPGLVSDSSELAVLTDREREVLQLVAAGLSNAEIAEKLVVSVLTVKTHVNRTMTKLGAHDRAQLVVIAYQSGLAQPYQQPAT